MLHGSFILRYFFFLGFFDIDEDCWFEFGENSRQKSFSNGIRALWGGLHENSGYIIVWNVHDWGSDFGNSL